MKQYLEDPDSMEEGTRFRVEAFFERVLVLRMGTKKLPHFLGENKDLVEAKRIAAENKRKRQEFMQKMQK